MHNTYSVPSTTATDNLKNTLLTDVQQKISNAALSVEGESKDKYITKNKLIEEADDMTTQEKLDALDKNYNQRNHEIWQNIITFTVISISVTGLIVGSPIAIKSVRKLVTA